MCVLARARVCVCVCVCACVVSHFAAAVKAHVRKGHALLAMKDTIRAGTAFEKALELDPQSVVSININF